MTPAALVEKGGDAHLLRQMTREIVERVSNRNGYRERDWETRAGAVNVRIPKLRSGSYFPPFLEPRRTAEKALATVIQEAYVQGVSTRSVDERAGARGMSGISKSQFGRLCGGIDERVNAFLERPREGDWPCLWIDATHVKCQIVLAAITRRVGALRLEQNDAWQLQRRYMSLEPLRALIDNQPAWLSAVVS